LNPEHWAHRVQAFGEGFGAKWFRVIDELEDMIEKALEVKQRTLFGIGLARHLAQVELTPSGNFFPRNAAGCVARGL